MAKKLSTRQKAARKKAAYVKAEYYKNVDAIRYLERFGVTKDIKIPQKITKASLKSIRRIYKEMRAGVKPYEGTKDYVDLTTGEVFEKLPTKAQAVKTYRQEQKEQAETFDPDRQYIEEIKNKISSISPKYDKSKTQKNYDKNVQPKLQKAEQDFSTAIDNAIANYGLEIVANVLADNNYMRRIENLDEKYAFEIIEDISDDGDLAILMNESAQSALSAL
jgi:hypothetical protein